MIARRIGIRRGEVLLIRDGSGTVVAVERGTAWLTQSGDRRDFVIEAGSPFRLDRAGVAAVSAETDVELIVTAAAGVGLPAIKTSPRAARPLPGGGYFAECEPVDHPSLKRTTPC